MSYSRGFKGGGFDPRGVTTPHGAEPARRNSQQIYDFMAFDPEKVDSYEARLKASLFDRRLQLATAIFDADYQDVQVPGSAGSVVNGSPTFSASPPTPARRASAASSSRPMLACAQDFATPGDRLNFSGTLGYLDAKYLAVHHEYRAASAPSTSPMIRKIQNTPKWTLSGSLDYDTPLAGGRLNLNTTLSYRSASQQFELAYADARPAGLLALGREHRLALARQPLRDRPARQEPDQQEIHRLGLQFPRPGPVHGRFHSECRRQPIPTLGKTAC